MLKANTDVEVVCANLELLAIIDQFQHCFKIHAESYPHCWSIIHDKNTNMYANTNQSQIQIK